MKGATPVPGPMSINGMSLSSGSLKCCCVLKYICVCKHNELLLPLLIGCLNHITIYDWLSLSQNNI